MEFKDLKIIEPLLKALKIKEYTTATEVQEMAIPELLNNRDVLGSAKTGTGKTAAFALPILQKIYEEKLENNTVEKKLQALILAPTRELALQIYDNFVEYSKFINVSATVVYGGIKQSRQTRDLQRGVDILVATPGRLLDLIEQKKLSLFDVKYLVLDEADRMLDMGFIHDVKKIVSMVRKERQTMLFSATMPSEITTFAKEILQNPVKIQVSPIEETVDAIKQTVYYVTNKSKIKLLIKLLKNEELKSVLIFSRTKRGADEISSELNIAGINSDVIHGDKAQGDRQIALKAFKKKEIRILIATDIASRGIDIDGVSHVINYDLPEIPETYIHRIGRTGRAGLGGITIAFCSPNQIHLLKDIEQHIKMKIPVSSDSNLSIDPSKIIEKPYKKKSDKPTNKPKTKRKADSYSRKNSEKKTGETKSYSSKNHKQQNRRSK